MDHQDLWPAVSQMLAVLTIGYSSMMLISKAFCLSASTVSTFIGKLVEVAAYLALISSSILILHPYVRSDLATEDNQRRPSVHGSTAITWAIQTYWYCAGLALASVCALWFAVRSARKPFNKPADHVFGVMTPALYGSLPILVYLDMYLEEIFPNYQSVFVHNKLFQLIVLIGVGVLITCITKLINRHRQSQSPAPVEPLES